MEALVSHSSTERMYLIWPSISTVAPLVVFATFSAKGLRTPFRLHVLFCMASCVEGKLEISQYVQTRLTLAVLEQKED